MYTHDNGIRVRIVYDAHRAPLLLYDGDEGPGVGRWMGGGWRKVMSAGRVPPRVYTDDARREQINNGRGRRAPACVYLTLRPT